MISSGLLFFFFKSDVNLPLKKKKGALWRRELLKHDRVRRLFPSNVTFQFAWWTRSRNVAVSSSVHAPLWAVILRCCHHIDSFSAEEWEEEVVLTPMSCSFYKSLFTLFFFIHWSYLHRAILFIRLILFIWLLVSASSSSSVFVWVHTEILSLQLSETTAGHNDVTEVWLWCIFAYAKCHTRQKHYTLHYSRSSQLQIQSGCIKLRIKLK